MLGSIDLPLFQESRVCRFGYEIACITMSVGTAEGIRMG